MNAATEVSGSAVTELLRAVARRRRHDALRVQARRFAWAVAPSLALAALVHALLHPLPLAWVAAATMLLLAALLAAAWAGPQTEPACAAWADRHLGGASAFGTWVDWRYGRLVNASPQATAALQAWAEGRAAKALRDVPSAAAEVALGRPLAALAGATALLLLASTLPAPAPPPGPPPPRVPAAAGAGPQAPTTARDAPAAPSAAALASLSAELDRALRQSASAERPRTAGSTPLDAAAGSGRASPRDAAGAQRGQLPRRAADQAARTAAVAAGVPVEAGRGGRGEGTGQAADTRREPGSSPPPAATDVPRSAPASETAFPAADLTRAGRFLDAGPAVPAPTDGWRVRAARAPAAFGGAQLRPAEAAYLQRWNRSPDTR